MNESRNVYCWDCEYMYCEDEPDFEKVCPECGSDNVEMEEVE